MEVEYRFEENLDSPEFLLQLLTEAEAEGKEVCFHLHCWQCGGPVVLIYDPHSYRPFDKYQARHLPHTHSWCAEEKILMSRESFIDKLSQCKCYAAIIY